MKKIWMDGFTTCLDSYPANQPTRGAIPPLSQNVFMA